MNIKKYKKGFSLVELLVVITIIAILSVTAFVALGGQTANARNSRRQQDLMALQSALEIYYIQNNNTYPADPPGLLALMPDLMNKLPVDPTTNGAYDYFVNAAAKKYSLAATFEVGDTFEAYVISNATPPEMGDADNNEGVAVDGGAVCTVEPDGTTKLLCLPYAL